MGFTLYTPTDQICFLSQFDRLEFSFLDATSGDVAITTRGTEIFRSSYVHDESGRITIYDLDKVMAPYMDLDDLRSNRFTLYFGDAPRQVLVLPGTTSVSESAMTFYPDFFLTPMMGERDTCVGRFETVTPFALDATAYTIVASYYDGTAIQTRQIQRMTVGDDTPIDVSPAQFVDDTIGSLVAYTVQCGKRKARYRVLPSMPEADPAIIFRNSFGCWETIYLTGLKNQQPKYTRSSAIVNGRLKTYDIDEEMSWEAQTGPMRPGMVAVANDLARSKAVFLLDAQGNAAAEIVITDCDTEVGNADDEIANMKFTYRRASLRTALIETVRPPRVFDRHFDSNFN